MLRSTFALILVGLGTVACQEADAPSETAQPTAELTPAQDAVSVSGDNAGETVGNRYADWAGKWTGPEGLFVEINPQSTGSYRLTMQSDLDTYGTYEGKPVEKGISFVRAGETLILQAVSGEETGLKYLAEKDDCLMVQRGEGYCRD
ncbi:MAG: hypothetical protein WA979_06225 [Pacificimonas sp.]